MVRLDEITHDVSEAIKTVVVETTEFQDPTIASEARRAFRFDLVPQASLWNGWGADAPHWETQLSRIHHEIRKRRPEYAFLRRRNRDPEKTVELSLSDTRTLIVDRMLVRLWESA